MAQPALSDDDDDLDFGNPSSGGGFGASGRFGSGGGAGSRLGASGRDAFGVPPREQKPLTEVEKLQREIADLEKRQQEKKTERETAEGEGKNAEEELKRRRERKESFLHLYAQSFQGAPPSLGNFEEELKFFEDRKDAFCEKAKKSEEDFASLGKEIEEKKRELVLKQEEEAKKHREEAISGSGVSAEQGEEKKSSESGGTVDGVKAYWEALSWEEKKKIFSVRDGIVEKVNEEGLDWGAFLDRVKLLELGGVFDEKMRDAKDAKGSALLLTIAAHREGKLQGLENEIL